MTPSQFVKSTPPPRLRALISDISGYRVHSAPGVHRGLPSSDLTLIITLDETVDVSFESGPQVSYTALVGGLHSKPTQVEHGELQHGIQLGLTPLGARALLGVPAGELADTGIHLSDVLGPTAAELTERLRSATTWSDRFDLLCGELDRLTSPAALPSAELGWIWRRMAETDGHVPVSALADEVGWSRQHLGARFRREFGLSPKLLGRVMRFQSARRHLIAGNPAGLADLAADCGYSDQAHFNRDWREFTGMTPSQWIAEELPFVQGATHLGDASSGHDDEHDANRDLAPGPLPRQESGHPLPGRGVRLRRSPDRSR
ncbi:helix-turn-helix domain-containing protein [Saccharopolyspora sp. WRP15-2]|uniref:Helix-turn-helix domain-containing protein n=1 Tax=Saccharopolyspora oryzae TaxID=2997343 RepID=A0ABT4V9L7_9PSEU|nr:helix-turn-helix domain-containing protein [Saccharopolyspora oryzae]MDA3630665.1 helix-turn-helix domain-containing protein [Saccharopolyspora oryzae]